MDGADKAAVGCAKLRARTQKVLRDNGNVLEGSSRLTDNLHAFCFVHVWSIAIVVRKTFVGKAFGICLCYWYMVGWKSCISILKVYFLRQNPMSMLEAHYSEDAWMRAVYADETLVGFLMMAIWPPTDGYYIWRFMIDQRYQKLGFGRTVVGMAIQHIGYNLHMVRYHVVTALINGRF